MYKTEDELIDAIDDLEKLAKEGRLTFPKAKELSRLRSELEAIQKVKTGVNIWA